MRVYTSFLFPKTKAVKNYYKKLMTEL